MAEFECEFKPICNNNCNNCTFAKEQIKIQRHNEAVANLKNALKEAVAPLHEATIKVFQKLQLINFQVHFKKGGRQQ